MPTHFSRLLKSRTSEKAVNTWLRDESFVTGIQNVICKWRYTTITAMRDSNSFIPKSPLPRSPGQGSWIAQRVACWVYNVIRKLRPIGRAKANNNDSLFITRASSARLRPGQYKTHPTHPISAWCLDEDRLESSLWTGMWTRNSSGDEIANVNFLYDDIVHALQNSIDSCINSATYRRGYVLEHRFNKFIKIAQCNGHYAVQGHSRSPISAPIESSVNDTNLPPILHLFQVMAGYWSNFR